MKKPLLLATLIGSALLVGCGETASGQKPAMAPLAQAQSVQLIQYQQVKSAAAAISQAKAQVQRSNWFSSLDCSCRKECHFDC